MNDILTAIKNPGWWVLTVVVGLILNVFAPFVNKFIESAWASRTKKKKALLSAYERAVRDSLKDLISRPTGLIEAKIDSIYWAVRIVLALSIYLMLIQVCFAIPFLPGQLTVAPLSLIAFFSISDHWGKWKLAMRIHNQLTIQIKDLGIKHPK